MKLGNVFGAIAAAMLALGFAVRLAEPGRDAMTYLWFAALASALSLAFTVIEVVQAIANEDAKSKRD